MMTIDTHYQVVKILDCDLPKYVLTGPLSRDTMYTLNISGPWRTKEINNLIAALELQREWLAADEADEARAAEPSTTSD